jgi:hypothetical protein
MARVYVASSWRNPHQPRIVALLRGAGHQVYDFRAPFHREAGFSWSQIGRDWQSWSPEEHRTALLTDPRASHAYLSDLRAMEWADTCVLVLPCGRSAHLEAGWFCGRGKRCVILQTTRCEPELMNLLATDLVCSEDELVSVLGRVPPVACGLDPRQAAEYFAEVAP